ncbi:hypothetical protein RRG08_007182 [Elysia crispata]|uniref:Uncharacterized protein n=1 Tax=Elysia crispata TaxID=231223 RepID=A0AAE1E9V2_9GAST|nr:hypothetical protein RRG08_007182 [Elysia crispata]
MVPCSCLYVCPHYDSLFLSLRLSSLRFPVLVSTFVLTRFPFLVSSCTFVLTMVPCSCLYVCPHHGSLFLSAFVLTMVLCSCLYVCLHYGSLFLSLRLSSPGFPFLVSSSTFVSLRFPVLVSTFVLTMVLCSCLYVCPLYGSLFLSLRLSSLWFSVLVSTFVLTTVICSCLCVCSHYGSLFLSLRARANKAADGERPRECSTLSDVNSPDLYWSWPISFSSTCISDELWHRQHN